MFFHTLVFLKSSKYSGGVESQRSILSRYAWKTIGIPPLKLNSSPLKRYRNPIGKDRLPSAIFQGFPLLNFGRGYISPQAGDKDNVLRNSNRQGGDINSQASPQTPK